AIAIYKKVLKLDSRAAEARVRLADLYARRDLTMEARVEYLAVADLFVRDGNEARAREVYEKLVRMEPGDVKARTALAEVFIAKGEEARAVTELQKAAADLEGIGLARESLIVHRRVLSLGLPEVGRMLDSIRAAIRLGDPEAAIASAQSLLSRFPEEN